MRRLRLLLFVALCSAGSVGAATPLPFNADTPATLRAQYAGRPYIVAFWSMECGHCQGELRTFAKWLRSRPDLPLVLVATDPAEQLPAIAARLDELGLAEADSRVFDDPLPDRLRFAVDRKWRGELPRTYFYDAAHRATPVTGAVDDKKLEEWVAAHLP